MSTPYRLVGGYTPDGLSEEIPADTVLAITRYDEGGWCLADHTTSVGDLVQAWVPTSWLAAVEDAPPAGPPPEPAPEPPSAGPQDEDVAAFGAPPTVPVDETPTPAVEENLYGYVDRDTTQAAQHTSERDDGSPPPESAPVPTAAPETTAAVAASTAARAQVPVPEPEPEPELEPEPEGMPPDPPSTVDETPSGPAQETTQPSPRRLPATSAMPPPPAPPTASVGVAGPPSSGAEGGMAPIPESAGIADAEVAPMDASPAVAEAAPRRLSMVGGRGIPEFSSDESSGDEYEGPPSSAGQASAAGAAAASEAPAADDCCFARAVFDFKPEAADELAMAAGDIIRVVSGGGKEWWTGVNDGNVGHFPRTYVQPLDASGSPVEHVPLAPSASATPEPRPPAEEAAEAEPAPPLPPKQRSSIGNEAGLGGMRKRTLTLSGPGGGGQGSAAQEREEHAAREEAARKRKQQAAEAEAEARRKADEQAAAAAAAERAAAERAAAERAAAERAAAEEQKRLLQAEQQPRTAAKKSVKRPGARRNTVSQAGERVRVVRLAAERPDTRQGVQRSSSIDGAAAMATGRRGTMDRVALARDPCLRLASDLQTLRPHLEGWRHGSSGGTRGCLLKHGDIMKISKGKAQCRTFFLFDHVFFWCKRDKGQLTVKGQLPMADVSIKNLADGSHKQNGHPVVNCWRLHNQEKDKWYILYTGTAEEKALWLASMRLEEEERAEQPLPAGTTAFTLSATRSDTHGFGFDMQERAPNGRKGCVVATITEPMLCPGLETGDVVRRINGIGVHHMSLDEVVGMM